MAMAGVSNEKTGIDGLSQRIVGSAKGLAYSTLSSHPRIQDGLRSRDLFGVGKSVSTPTIRRGITPTDFFDVVVRSSSSASSILDKGFQKQAEKDAQSAEDEFQSFLGNRRGLLSEENMLLSAASRRGAVAAQRSDDISLKRRDLRRKTRRDIYEPANPQSDAELENPEPVWERRSEGEVVGQEDGEPKWRWRHEWRRIRKQEDANSDNRQYKVDPMPECDLTRVMREGSESRQSVAVTRLNQIRRHLAVMDTIPSDLDSWKADWHMHLERCDGIVNREEDKLSPEPEQEELEKYFFHCPYRECHYRLLRQCENLFLAIRQRPCVHDGCGYVSQTVDEWLKHVTGAHHGI